MAIEQKIVEHRIKELRDHGYIKLPPLPAKHWMLTDKGWRCLFACADPPRQKPPKIKETL